mgnify:CR=1 FL=1
MKYLKSKQARDKKKAAAGAGSPALRPVASVKDEDVVSGVAGNLATWQPGNLATWQPGGLAVNSAGAPALLHAACRAAALPPWPLFVTPLRRCWSKQEEAEVAGADDEGASVEEQDEEVD